MIRFSLVSQETVEFDFPNSTLSLEVGEYVAKVHHFEELVKVLRSFSGEAVARTCSLKAGWRLTVEGKRFCRWPRGARAHARTCTA